MDISLCMIVKDEEDCLGECLDNIYNYVDEIIIVDTGSKDKTKKIAKRYTDKIYNYEWCDNFAKARNFSISKASNDWIMVLDADELIIKFNKQAIQDFIKFNNDSVGRIKIINIFSDDNNMVKKSHEYVSRIFNRKLYYYNGSIHEQIVSKDPFIYNTEKIALEVEHIGYKKTRVNKKNKIERNIKILEKAIGKNPNDSYLYYQLGKSYYMDQKYDNAYKKFKRAIDLCPDFEYDYANDLVESYGYSLLKCEQYDKSLIIEEYKSYYAELPDFNFILGLIYMNNVMFEKAIITFRKCISNREGKIEGINSYLPYYNIGVIYENLGLQEKAFESYKSCEKYEPAMDRIKRIVEMKIEKGQLNAAKALIVECNNILCNDVQFISIKGVIDIMDNKLSKAENTLNKGLIIDKNSFDILYNLGFLYEIKNDYKTAVNFYKKAMNTTISENIRKELFNKIQILKQNKV